jgi:hypothetical protein
LGPFRLSQYDRLDGFEGGRARGIRTSDREGEQMQRSETVKTAVENEWLLFRRDRNEWIQLIMQIIGKKSVNLTRSDGAHNKVADVSCLQNI